MTSPSVAVKVMTNIVTFASNQSTTACRAEPSARSVVYGMAGCPATRRGKHVVAIPEVPHGALNPASAHAEANTPNRASGPGLRKASIK
jgi:hypothetical protein